MVSVSMIVLAICALLFAGFSCLGGHYTNLVTQRTTSKNLQFDVDVKQRFDLQKNIAFTKAMRVQQSTQGWKQKMVSCFMSMDTDEMQDMQVCAILKSKMNDVKANPTAKNIEAFKNWTQHEQYLPVEKKKGTCFQLRDCGRHWEKQQIRLNNLNTKLYVKIQNDLHREIDEIDYSMHLIVWLLTGFFCSVAAFGAVASLKKIGQDLCTVE